MVAQLCKYTKDNWLEHLNRLLLWYENDTLVKLF